MFREILASFSYKRNFFSAEDFFLLVVERYKKKYIKIWFQKHKKEFSSHFQKEYLAIFCVVDSYLWTVNERFFFFENQFTEYFFIRCSEIFMSCSVQSVMNILMFSERFSILLPLGRFFSAFSFFTINFPNKNRQRSDKTQRQATKRMIMCRSIHNSITKQSD
jgi:hypothetical protein